MKTPFDWRRRISGVTRAALHQTVTSQVVTAAAALMQLTLLSRLLTTSDYADYIVATAVWAMGNAAAGIGIGLRISHDAATGVERVSFTRAECFRTLGVSLLGGVAFWLLSGDLAKGALVSTVLLSYVLAEIAISIFVGKKDFSLYLRVAIIRAVTPVGVIAVYAVFAQPTFLVAAGALLLGNVLAASSAYPWVDLRLAQTSALATSATGLISLALWVLASADKVVLDHFVTADSLAGYALAYSILDRVFRALQTMYTSKHVADAFSSKLRLPSAMLTLALLSGAIALGPITVWACRWISGGRYEPSIEGAVILALGLALMAYSSPYYLSMLATKSYSLPLLAIVTISLGNIVVNILLLPHYGTIVAAINTLVCYFAWTVFLLWQTRRLRRVERSTLADVN